MHFRLLCDILAWKLLESLNLKKENPDSSHFKQHLDSSLYFLLMLCFQQNWLSMLSNALSGDSEVAPSPQGTGGVRIRIIYRPNYGATPI